MKITGLVYSRTGCSRLIIKENFTVATRIKFNGKVYESKSAAARAMYDAGKTVTEVTHLIPNMGYAFAYGIAKRYGKATTAANRKATKPVSTSETKVQVKTKTGKTVTVDLITGKVTTTTTK